MHSGVEYLNTDDASEEKISLMPYIAFVIIFILVFVAILLLTKFLKKILDYTLLGSFDNWAGALFGGLKIAFALSLIIWLTKYAKVDLPKNLVDDSFIYPNLVSFAPNLIHYISYVIPFQDIFPLIEKSIAGK
jgi:membrane protein required for colicin V production